METPKGLLILIIFLVYISKCATSVPFEVTGFKCIKQNRTVCQNNVCALKKRVRGINLINLYCYFPVPITNVTVNVILFKKERNVYKRWIVNMEEDLCRLFAGTAYSTVFSKLLTSIRKYTDFIHPCPFIGNFTIKDYPIDISFIHTILPKGQFRIDGTVKTTADKKIYFVAQAFFSLN